MSVTSLRSRAAVLAVLAATALLTACSRAAETPAASTPAANTTPAAELRLGYFPNITHAPALIGVARNTFATELGAGTTLTTQTFNAGPDEVNALLGGSLDAGFIGSSPAINAFAKSNGAITLISGSTSAGAQLVTSADITTPEQLKGKIIATPQLGNTQDVALKKWLKENNLEIGEGPDKVTVQNIDNSKTLDLFKGGQVAGGWLPEPWSSRLVDAGATVLVDEKTLWADGKFPTTVLIVRTQFLQDHPQTVQALLAGTQKSIDFADANPAEAKSIANDSIKKISGSALSPAVLDRAFTELSFDSDPLAATFPQLSKDSVTAGVTQRETNLKGLIDVALLNAVRQADGKTPVDAAGLSRS